MEGAFATYASACRCFRDQASMLQFISKRRFWLPQLGWRRPLINARVTRRIKQAVLAFRLWASVVEIQHTPSQFRPPIRRRPCTAAGRQCCTAWRGGIQFPFIGCWAKRGVLCIPGERAEDAWQCYIYGWLTLLALEAIKTECAVLSMLPTINKALRRLGRPVPWCHRRAGRGSTPV